MDILNTTTAFNVALYRLLIMFDDKNTYSLIFLCFILEFSPFDVLMYSEDFILQGKVATLLR